MDKPVEILLFEFLESVIATAGVGDPLFEAELHDTVHQPIRGDRVVRISEAVGDLAPGPLMEVKEYDVQLIVTCCSRVTGKEKTERQPALADVFRMQKAVFAELITDPTLGGRVCDLVVMRGGRGYDIYNGEPFAVTNMPVVLNPSGARLAGFGRD